MKTVLCVPGHDEHKVKNCRKYGADLILFDLEDSVPEGMKDRAREIVAANVRPGDAVRAADWISDSVHYGKLGASIWFPKIGDRADLNILVPASAHLSRGQAVPLIETPAALFDLMHIALSVPCGGLAFGAADFAAYMNVPHNSQQVAYARQQVALAAAALGVPAYDSPCTVLHSGVLERECDNALALGYVWKGAIHPSQLPRIKMVGTRSPGYDREFIELYERERNGEAIVRLP
jgi:citrate lyase beta subunit